MGDAEPLHFRQQSGALEAQTGRRAFLSSDDSASLPQSLQYMLALDILQSVHRCGEDRTRLLQLAESNLKNASRCQYHGSFDEVL